MYSTPYQHQWNVWQRSLLLVGSGCHFLRHKTGLSSYKATWGVGSKQLLRSLASELLSLHHCLQF